MKQQQICFLGADDIGRDGLIRILCQDKEMDRNVEVNVYWTTQYTKSEKLNICFLKLPRSQQLLGVQNDVITRSEIFVGCFHLDKDRSFQILKEIRKKLLAMNFDEVTRMKIKKNFFLVGLKSENEENHEVSVVDVKDVKHKWGCPYFEIVLPAADDDRKVKELYEQLIKRLMYLRSNPLYKLFNMIGCMDTEPVPSTS